MLNHSDHIQQLADYIKKNLSKGYTPESLKFALLNQDYSRASIERAMKIANQEIAKKAPVMKEKPVIKYQIIDEQGNTKQEFTKKKSFLGRLFS